MKKGFIKKYKIIFTPTLIFFSDDGKEAFRMNGYSPPHKFLAALQYVSERRYQSGEKYIDFFKKIKLAAASGKLHIPSGEITPPLSIS